MAIPAKTFSQTWKPSKTTSKALLAINERYQIHGDYENHTERFGSPIWDLWLS